MIFDESFELTYEIHRSLNRYVRRCRQYDPWKYVVKIYTLESMFP